MVLPTGWAAIRKKSRIDTVSGTVVGGTVVGGTVAGGTVVGATVVVGTGAVVDGAGVVVVGMADWAQPQSSSTNSSNAVKRFMSILRFLCFFRSDYNMPGNKMQGRLAIPPEGCIMKPSNNKGCSYALPFPAFPRRQA
jgi:hypothetical protein